MRTLLVCCVLALTGLCLGPGRPWAAETGAAGDEVDYSAGTAAPSPPSKAAPPSATPDLSIHLELFDRLPPAKAAPAPSPPTANGPTSPMPVPSPPPPSGAPPASVNRNSPILAMLRSTLRGDYAETLDTLRRTPKKTFSQRFDRAAANTYSRLGNERINKQDDPPGAVAAYETAYSYDQSSSEINGSYGYALFRAGRFPEARDKEIEALEIAPGYGAAWFTLGQIFGYLKEEDNAYGCFVTTCLVTKNLNTTLGFLDREKDKIGEECVQRAAAKALETCRRLTRPDGAVRESDRQPAPAPTSTPAPAAVGRVGQIDAQQIVLASRQFPEIAARLSALQGLSKQESDKRLEAMLSPLLETVRDHTRRYARSHGYTVVLDVRQVAAFRQGQPLGPNTLPFSDFGVETMTFLNSDPGRSFRRTVPIEDLTQTVQGLVNGR